MLVVAGWSTPWGLGLYGESQGFGHEKFLGYLKKIKNKKNSTTKAIQKKCNSTLFKDQYIYKKRPKLCNFHLFDLHIKFQLRLITLREMHMKVEVVKVQKEK